MNGTDDNLFSSEEEEALKSLLEEGEEIRWSGRPQIKLSSRRSISNFSSALLSLLLLVFIFLSFPPQEGNASREVLVFFLLPVLLFCLFLFFRPLYERWRLSQALYLLTDRRAMVLCPGFGEMQHWSFPYSCSLMVIASTSARGLGDLLFCEREEQGACANCPVPETNYDDVRSPFSQGFLRVPDVLALEEEARRLCRLYVSPAARGEEKKAVGEGSLQDKM